MFENTPFDRFTPSSTDKNILNEMYKETPIQTNVLSLEDFLKLPVNDQYRINSLEKSVERFNLKSVPNITNDIYTTENGKVC